MDGRPIRLGELAARLGRELEGDPQRCVSSVASLADAGPEDLAFVRSSAFADALAGSRAGALIAPPGLDVGARPAIRSPRPDLDFTRAAALVVPPERPAPGVHATAVVASDAEVHPGASVGAHAVIGPRCRVGAGSVVHPHAVLYADVRVGRECVIHSGVVLRERTELGDRVVLQPGVTLGGDGFGFTLDEQGAWVKLPQLGRVVVEDDVEIGAHTAVDRGTLGATRIGRGSKLDNLIQIAHNCELGEHVLVVAQAGFAGSTRIDSRALVMAQAGAAGHVRIGEGAFVGGRAGVHRDVPPRARVWGFPQMEERRWHRVMSALARLPDALRRLRAVERRLGLEEPPRKEKGP